MALREYGRGFARAFGGVMGFLWDCTRFFGGFILVYRLKGFTGSEQAAAAEVLPGFHSGLSCRGYRGFHRLATPRVH